MPVFAVLLGVLMFAAMAIGGDPWGGLGSLAIMAAVAALFLFGGRSDTLSGIGGPGRDERWSKIDLTATAYAGGVLVIAILGAWLWEMAHGDDGSPYVQLGAVGGLAYVLAVAFLRRRS